jgi:hypothetical protein
MQGSLFDQEKETAAEQRFREFDEKNPAVYKNIIRLTRDLLARGHKRVGMQMIFEVIRWQSMLRTEGDQFKMNNNYASRYARKAMEEFPEFDGVFEIRKLQS